MEGNVYISGAVNYDSQNNPIGHPVAIRAIERQRSDPEGYDLSRKNLDKRSQAISEEEFLEGTDDLGDIYFSTESSGKISDFMKTIFDDNEKSLFEYAYSENDNAEQDGDEETSKKFEMGIDKPSRYKIKFVDKIINFNSFTDTLEIDTDSFGIDSSATFAAGKNKKIVKKKLAKQDFDFLYDEKKGGLYFNENGADKGFGEGGIIAILKGAPDLSFGNLEFV